MSRVGLFLCAESLQSCLTLCNPVDLWTIASTLLCPWDSLGKDTGAGCHALLQGIFPTQGLNLSLLISSFDRRVLYHWRYLGSILVGIANSYWENFQPWSDQGEFPGGGGSDLNLEQKNHVCLDPSLSRSLL